MALSLTPYSLPMLKKDYVLILSFNSSRLGLSLFLVVKDQQVEHKPVLLLEVISFPQLEHIWCGRGDSNSYAELPTPGSKPGSSTDLDTPAYFPLFAPEFPS